MAATQKRKNVAALHKAAALDGYFPLLEVSTKSVDSMGQQLSAFNIQINVSPSLHVPLECAYQGSKIFEYGGPFKDIYTSTSLDAKRDPRLKSSGELVGFRFDDIHFALTPKSAFYDWLYLQVLYKAHDFLDYLEIFAGFTDIEFNPKASVNCQARSCARVVALRKRGLLAEAYGSVERYLDIVSSPSFKQEHLETQHQAALFGSH